MSKTNNLRFVLMVLLPLLFAAGLAWFQTSNLINGLVALSEKTDYTRSENLIQSGFKAARHQLESFVSDSAHWDEAARNVNLELDLNWIHNTWYTSATDLDGIYDLVMVVDGETNTVIAANRNGKEQSFVVSDVFGANWPMILAALPNDPNKTGIVSAFLKADRGPAVVAVAPIVATTPELATTKKRTSYLIMMLDLDERLVAQIGDQYKVPELKLVTGLEAGRGNVSVLDEFGFYSPKFSWLTNQQAFAGSWQLWERALITLTATLVVLLGMAIAYWRVLRKLQLNESKAIHAAFHDSLTGLGNRAGFDQFLNEITANQNWNCSVAFADLDSFKAVNDTMGHHRGDLLLQKVAKVILKTVGANGRVFRLGGDEFVVLFPGTCQHSVVNDYASNLISALQNSFELSGKIAKVGVSIGIAHSANSCSTASELIRRADEAMYLAKQAGRNRFVEHGSSQVDLERAIQQIKQVSGRLRDQKTSNSANQADIAVLSSV